MFTGKASGKMKLEIIATDKTVTCSKHGLAQVARIDNEDSNGFGMVMNVCSECLIEECHKWENNDGRDEGDTGR